MTLCSLSLSSVLSVSLLEKILLVRRPPSACAAHALGLLDLADSAYFHMATFSAALPPFPRGGVSLKILLALRDLVVQQYDPQWTTTDVCDNLIKPWTEPTQTSFAELMNLSYFIQPHPTLGLTYNESFHPVAHIFISHAWKYIFAEVVDTIQLFFEQNDENLSSETTFLWFDLFLNNQWSAPRLPQEWWKSVFKEAIQEIGRTMMIALPWHKPITITRAWCLWELYCTRVTNSKLMLALGRNEQLTFKQNLDRMVLEEEYDVLEDLDGIDVKESDAWNPADKEMILQAVASMPGGFEAVNNQVKGLLLPWYVETLRKHYPTVGYDNTGAAGDMQIMHDLQDRLLSMAYFYKDDSDSDSDSSSEESN
jgi:hypothetical protein